MTMARALACVYATFLGGLGAAAFVSCVDETTPPGYTGATGVPSISIVSPTEGSCVEVTAGVNAFVPVEVFLGSPADPTFILRPPGACVGLTNCGQVRLKVNGLDNNVSATTIVDVNFDGPIASPYGTLKLEVELINDEGYAWILPPDAGTANDYFGPYTATATITTAASCTGDAGS
jgi:hypothetical protein